MTRRATLRGADRVPLDARADVLICGASFAGLAVARELAGSGADVLVVDRYEIGERQTSACAAPTPWLEAMGVRDAIRQELPCMAFHTPHGSARMRLPWSWSAFDYRTLCEELWAQCDARFEIAKVERRVGDSVVETDRGADHGAADRRRARLAPGARLRAERPAARGADLARAGGPSGRARRRHRPRRLDRPVADPLRLRLVGPRGRRAAGRRRLVRAARPRQGADARRSPAGSACAPVRYQGNWFPHALRPAAADGVFFAGDSAGHCLPLSGEGIRTAFYFGIACGRELRRVLSGAATREEALAAYGAFSEAHRPAFALALRLQRLIPALPPRVLTALLGVVGRERPCRRAFTWYLEQAHPRFATARQRERSVA